MDEEEQLNLNLKRNERLYSFFKDEKILLQLVHYVRKRIGTPSSQITTGGDYQPQIDELQNEIDGINTRLDNAESEIERINRIVNEINAVTIASYNEIQRLEDILFCTSARDNNAVGVLPMSAVSDDTVILGTPNTYFHPVSGPTSFSISPYLGDCEFVIKYDVVTEGQPSHGYPIWQVSGYESASLGYTVAGRRLVTGWDVGLQKYIYKEIGAGSLFSAGASESEMSELYINNAEQEWIIKYDKESRTITFGVNGGANHTYTLKKEEVENDFIVYIGGYYEESSDSVKPYVVLSKIENKTSMITDLKGDSVVTCWDVKISTWDTEVTRLFCGAWVKDITYNGKITYVIQEPNWLLSAYTTSTVLYVPGMQFASYYAMTARLTKNRISNVIKASKRVLTQLKENLEGTLFSNIIEKMVASTYLISTNLLALNDAAVQRTELVVQFGEFSLENWSTFITGPAGNSVKYTKTTASSITWPGDSEVISGSSEFSPRSHQQGNIDGWDESGVETFQGNGYIVIASGTTSFSPALFGISDTYELGNGSPPQTYSLTRRSAQTSISTTLKFKLQLNFTSFPGAGVVITNDGLISIKVDEFGYSSSLGIPWETPNVDPDTGIVTIEANLEVPTVGFEAFSRYDVGDEPLTSTVGTFSIQPGDYDLTENIRIDNDQSKLNIWLYNVQKPHLWANTPASNYRCVLDGRAHEPIIVKLSMLSPTTIEYVKSPVLNVDTVQDGTEQAITNAVLELALNQWQMAIKLKVLDYRLTQVEKWTRPTIVGGIAGGLFAFSNFLPGGRLLTVTLILGTSFQILDTIVRGRYIDFLTLFMGASMAGMNEYRVRHSGSYELANDCYLVSQRNLNLDSIDTPSVTRTSDATIAENEFIDERDPDRDPDGIRDEYDGLIETGDALTSVMGEVILVGRQIENMNFFDNAYAHYDAWIKGGGIKKQAAVALEMSHLSPEHQYVYIDQKGLLDDEEGGEITVGVKVSYGIGTSADLGNTVDGFVDGTLSGGDSGQTAGVAAVFYSVNEEGVEFALSMEDLPNSTELQMEIERNALLVMNGIFKHPSELGDKDPYQILRRASNHDLIVELASSIYETDYTTRRRKEMLIPLEAIEVIVNQNSATGGLRDQWIYSILNHSCQHFADSMYGFITTGIGDKNIPVTFRDEYQNALNNNTNGHYTQDQLIRIMTDFYSAILVSYATSPGY